MRIHKEGKDTLIFAFITLIVIAIIIFYFLSPSSLYIFLGTSLAFYFFLLHFFRNPIISIHKDPKAILAPAEGKVVIVKKSFEDEVLKKEMTQISIFMSPLNVHCNYSPIDGEVTFYKYHSGKYLVAWAPKSSLLNERTTLAIKHSNGDEILVRQIAGAVARRIVCYAEKGVNVEQGKEFGFIKFGSRVDVFVPTDANIKVQEGDKVKPGKTILGTFN